MGRPIHTSDEMFLTPAVAGQMLHQKSVEDMNWLMERGYINWCYHKSSRVIFVEDLWAFARWVASRDFEGIPDRSNPKNFMFAPSANNILRKRDTEKQLRAQSIGFAKNKKQAA